MLITAHTFAAGNAMAAMSGRRVFDSATHSDCKRPIMPQPFAEL